MTLSEKDKAVMIDYRLTQADETVKEAELLIENKMFRAATNRIYYGVFYSLLALALKYDFSTSKHSQLIGWFNKNIISENILDREIGRIVGKLYESRIKGDYDSFITISETEISTRLEDMKKAISAIRELSVKK